MRLRAFLGALLLSAGLPLLAKDESVSFDGLEGKLHLPEQPTGRAVLLLHGFNGTMDEVGDLYADLAAELGRRGIASLRFNYSGEGERVDFIVTSTLESRIRETELAYAYLRQRLPEDRLGVNGFSLGGLTAMAVAGLHPDWFETMVLWSAADAMDKDGDPAYSAAVQKAVREGRASYQDWTRITLTREFAVSFAGVSASHWLPNYPGAFFAIRGDKDYLPQMDPRWLTIVSTENKSSLLIGGADHIFNVLDIPRPDFGRRAIEATADRFDATLNSSLE